MRSEIIAEVKMEKGAHPVFTGAGKHIRYYQFESEWDRPDIDCTLETLQRDIRVAEHTIGIPLTTLKLGLEAFSLIAKATDPAMTKTELSKAVGLKTELVQETMKEEEK